MGKKNISQVISKDEVARYVAIAAEVKAKGKSADPAKAMARIEKALAGITTEKDVTEDIPATEGIMLDGSLGAVLSVGNIDVNTDVQVELPKVVADEEEDEAKEERSLWGDGEKVWVCGNCGILIDVAQEARAGGDGICISCIELQASFKNAHLAEDHAINISVNGSPGSGSFPITLESLEGLATHLPENTTIESITIHSGYSIEPKRYNNFEGGDLLGERSSGECLGTLLLKCTQLKNLTLGNIGFSQESFAAMVALLPNVMALEMICFQGTHFQGGVGEYDTLQELLTKCSHEGLSRKGNLHTVCSVKTLDCSDAFDDPKKLHALKKHFNIDKVSYWTGSGQNLHEHFA